MRPIKDFITENIGVILLIIFLIFSYKYFYKTYYLNEKRLYYPKVDSISLADSSSLKEFDLSLDGDLKAEQEIYNMLVNTDYYRLPYYSFIYKDKDHVIVNISAYESQRATSTESNNNSEILFNIKYYENGHVFINYYGESNRFKDGFYRPKYRDGKYIYKYIKDGCLG